jgi:hypothetical protein
MMSRVDIVHYVGATTYSPSVVASLSKKLRDEGYEVRILDLSPLSAVSQELPPAWIVRLLGHRIYKGKLQEVLDGLGVTRVVAQKSSDALPALPEADAPSVYQALESEMLTYFRRETIPDKGRFARFREKLERNLLTTYGWLSELWDTDPPVFVCIPNGRTSRQKAAWRAADRLGVPVRIYEIGRAKPKAYYFGTTQPHDRIGSQAEIPTLPNFPGESETKALAEEWLKARMGSGTGTNEFTSLWSAGVEGFPAGATAVFFTSSVDELLASGPMWTIDEWNRPLEAFDVIMSILEKRGVNLVMRLHPNLGSKSRHYFRQEVQRINDLCAQHPTLKVYWHNSPINSYELVTAADMVFVERSTIGLEASLLGKPVWVTRATQWDLTADIRQMLSLSDITEEALMPWKPDPRGAQKFVAYWMLQEHEFDYDWSTWATWNPERPPLAIKIARLAVRNSWAHRFHLVSAELTRRRNNRFRAPRTPPPHL